MLKKFFRYVWDLLAEIGRLRAEAHIKHKRWDY